MGKIDVWTSVCNLIFSHPHRGNWWRETDSKMLLCQSGNRKSESLVFTLKVWWQAAFVPGSMTPPLFQWPWRLGQGEEDQNCKGDVKALHQRSAFVFFSRRFWLSAVTAQGAIHFKCHSLLQRFKCWRCWHLRRM